MSDDNDRHHRKGSNTDGGSIVPVITFVAGIALGALAYFGVTMVEEQQQQRESSSTATRKPSSGGTLSLSAWIAENRGKPSPKEDRDLPELAACQICMDEKHKVTHVFECGHATCLECAVKLASELKRCPFDHTTILKAPRQLRLI